MQILRFHSTTTESENKGALAGMAQGIEYRPVHQSIAGSIPSQGTCLSCRPGPQWGACEGQPHIDVSLPLSFPSSLKKKEKESFPLLDLFVYLCVLYQ